MAQATNFDEDALRQTVKDALVETLLEHRELLYEVFAEFLKDLGLAKTIRQGRRTENITREEVFDVLEGKS